MTHFVLQGNLFFQIGSHILMLLFAVGIAVVAAIFDRLPPLVIALVAHCVSKRCGTLSVVLLYLAARAERQRNTSHA